jgi:hypothetical protein
MMSRNLHILKWIAILLAMGVIVIAGILLAHPARAHDSAHPEHNEWLRSLTNSSGYSCCDGTDALRIEDVDWQSVCEAGTGECHYQVRIAGAWWNVPEVAVVKGGNRLGPALVWPTIYFNHGDPADGVSSVAIRCFLPGAGT